MGIIHELLRRYWAIIVAAALYDESTLHIIRFQFLGSMSYQGIRSYLNNVRVRNVLHSRKGYSRGADRIICTAILQNSAG